MAIRFQPVIPILRIVDVAKAAEFYLGFLGFKVDWDHRSARTRRAAARFRPAS